MDQAGPHRHDGPRPPCPREMASGSWKPCWTLRTGLGCSESGPASPKLVFSLRKTQKQFPLKSPSWYWIKFPLVLFLHRELEMICTKIRWNPPFWGRANHTSTVLVLLKPYFEGLSSTWIMPRSSAPGWVSSMVKIFKEELVAPWDHQLNQLDITRLKNKLLQDKV